MLEDPAVELGNVYNMDETDVMSTMLSSAKWPLGKNDWQDYRGAEAKRLC